METVSLAGTGPLVFFLSERWSPETLRCTSHAGKAVLQVFSPWSIWQSCCECPLLRKDVWKETQSLGNSSRSLLGVLGNARQAQGTANPSIFRGVSVWHVHWKVWTKCRGACFLSISHLKRHLLHAFVCQVAILFWRHLLIALMTRSILQCASFMSGQGEEGVIIHNRTQKHRVCFPPPLRSSHVSWKLLTRYPATKLLQ